MGLQEAWRNSRLAGRGREIAILSGGLATLAVGSMVLGSFALRIHAVAPTSGAAIRSDTAVKVTFFGFPYAGRITLDGKEVTSRLSLTGQSMGCYLKGLPEGHHRVQVELFSPLKTVHAASDFVVDSTPPTITLNSLPNPLIVAQKHLKLKGLTETQTKLFLLRPAAKGSEPQVLQQVPADDSGKFMLDTDLEPGWNSLLIRAKDQAGNLTEKSLRVFFDTAAPQFTLERVVSDQEGDSARLDGHVADSFKLRIRLNARDDSGCIASASWSLDESPSKKVRLTRSPGAPGPNTVYKADWLLGDLPEGERKLTCSVTDKVGHVQTGTAVFLVDSSERLGERPMTRGARGADVIQLQKRLMEMGHLDKGEPSGIFDDDTEAAVRAFQVSQGFEPSGKLGPLSLQALGPRIFVNLGLRSLVFDRPGQGVERFGVAIGAPAFPTPTGRYQITYKEKNPTWLPPNSPWAREAKSIPPGPGNPLGTRWIGLDSSCVGIHGTNADWTIGSAASHGCLRMHIPDVERLYEMVEPGIPVTIYAGSEKNADIKKYWP